MNNKQSIFSNLSFSVGGGCPKTSLSLTQCFLLGTDYTDFAERIKKIRVNPRNPCLKESTTGVLGQAGRCVKSPK